MTKQEIKKLDMLARIKCVCPLDIFIVPECEVCGKPGNQTHHYIGRRNRALRWVRANLFCVCPGCHTLRRDSFHQDPIWGREQAVRLRGISWEEKLRVVSRQLNKFTYEENIDMLDADIDEIMRRYGL